METKVNLLDCTQEPSDEQLSALMCSVAAEASAKAKVTKDNLSLTLRRQTAEVWMQHKVARSLADPRPNVPHDQVMAKARAYTQWLTEVVNESRKGIADGTNKRIESAEWERIRAEKLRQRAELLPRDDEPR
jgi:predicted amino acid-binding ACT domain protein